MGNIIRFLILFLIVSCTDNIEDEMKIVLANIGEGGQAPPPTFPESISFSFKATNGQSSSVVATPSYDTIENETELIYNDFRDNVFQPEIVNHDGFTVDGVKIGTQADNMPPVLMEVNVGGNHGYLGRNCNVPSHDKDDSDLYSLWQRDGGSEQVIIHALITDQIFVTPTVSGGFVAGTYSHVSGATHTGSINLSSSVTKNIYPNHKNISKKVYVDDIEVSNSSDQVFSAESHVSIVEIYDVVTYDSMVTHFLAQQGTGVPLTADTMDGDSRFRLTNTFTVDETGFISGLMELEFMQNEPIFSYYIGLQQVNLSSVGDEWYVSRTLPVTTADGTFDFREKVAFQQLTERIEFKSTEWEDANNIPDRHVAILNNSNRTYVQGFLPVLDASPSNRVINIGAREALTFRLTSEKMYMRAVHGFGTQTAGTKYSVISYRGVFKNDASRTCGYFVKDYSTGKAYFYGDWHDLPKTDNISVPPKYQGKNFTVVTKTSNISLVDGILGPVLNIAILDTASYGSIILEISA